MFERALYQWRLVHRRDKWLQLRVYRWLQRWQLPDKSARVVVRCLTVCCLDINECASQPCRHGGSCVDGLNSFSCTCFVGVIGTYCDTNIDECISAPCTNGGSCIDGIGGYSCT